MTPEAFNIAANRIRPAEQLRLKAYDDYDGRTVEPGKTVGGFVSVGYGRNLFGRGITVAEAEMLLMNDLKGADDDIKANFPWAEKLDAVRYAVMVEWVFNMGINNVKGFPKALAAIQTGLWAEAAKELCDFKQYRDPKLPGLKIRYDELAEMLKTGIKK